MTAKAEAHVRAEDHLARLAAALIHEEVPFTVKPEPDGWWRVRAPMLARDLHALVQTTRAPA